MVACIPFFAAAQPRGVNTITVHGMTLSQIDDSLNAKGFQIAKIEGDVITTKPRQYYSVEDERRKDHASIVIMVKPSGGDVAISAMYTYDELETKILGPHEQTGKPTRVENGYTKGSYMRRAFEYLNDFAKSLNNNLSYTRQ